MLYVVVGPNGALHSWNTDFRELRVPSNAVVVERPLWMQPPLAPYVWDPAAMDWVLPEAPQPAPLDEMTNTSFRWRYTFAEQTRIKRAEWEHPDADVRAGLATLRETLAETPRVRLSDQRTVNGVMFHASLGLITPERAVEILDPLWFGVES